MKRLIGIFFLLIVGAGTVLADTPGLHQGSLLLPGQHRRH